MELCHVRLSTGHRLCHTVQAEVQLSRQERESRIKQCDMLTSGVTVPPWHVHTAPVMLTVLTAARIQCVALYNARHSASNAICRYAIITCAICNVGAVTVAHLIELSVQFANI